MIQIKVNNFNFLTKSNISVLEACKFIGINIPRFCYHEILSVAGNCRLCLVEIEKSPKPMTACALPIINNMQIFTDTPLVKKARENILETLLINHPLDCPICDQAGECDLQDQSKLFGSDFSRFFFHKRGVEDKELGSLIKTIMTRCIHCTRCVRFEAEISGTEVLGTLNRGGSTEIGTYTTSALNSEVSGNVIDLCPVGALTSKPYAFKARPWEVRVNESIDICDSLGANIYVNFKESEIVRVLPKPNFELNGTLISDKTRFSYDSNNNNRLLKLFKTTNNLQKKHALINWQTFFENLDYSFKSNKKLLVVVDKEIDLESLNVLKNLAKKFRSKIKIKVLGKYSRENSFTGDYLSSKINDFKTVSKICFLLCSNIRLESVVLNTKLRSKYLNENFAVFGCGEVFKSSFPTQFVALNVASLFEIFESKVLNLSSIFLKTKAPLVLVGETLNKRYSNLNTFLSYLKRIVSTAIILNIKESSNSSGIELLNIHSLNKKDILESDVIFSVNLNDTILVRNFIQYFQKKTIFWLNSFGSSVATEAHFIVPTTTFFENEAIFVNLEGRFQKTSKIFSGVGASRHVGNIFMAFSANVNYKLDFLNYIYELLEIEEAFLSVGNPSLNNFYFKTAGQHKLNLYPSNSLIDDFYISGKSGKYSLTMSKCSKELRESIHSVNFL